MNYFKLPEIKSLAKLKFEIPSRLILGKRAELFFAELLKASDNYELIANNLQLIHQKKTLGEFDFLVKDLNVNKVLHIELVYKFYLYDPKMGSEIEKWVGPNRNDSLDRKLQHLKEHQLPLLFTSEAKNFLEPYQIDYSNLEQKVCFLANLFVPKKCYKEDIPLVNPNAIVGYYMGINDFLEDEYGEFQFYSPQKTNWSLLPNNHVDWMSFSEITKKINILHQHRKSVLLWVKKMENEFERIFVVWW